MLLALLLGIVVLLMLCLCCLVSLALIAQDIHVALCRTQGESPEPSSLSPFAFPLSPSETEDTP